jgi:hypothetical protein
VPSTPRGWVSGRGSGSPSFRTRRPRPRSEVGAERRGLFPRLRDMALPAGSDRPRAGVSRHCGARVCADDPLGRDAARDPGLDPDRRGVGRLAGLAPARTRAAISRGGPAWLSAALFPNPTSRNGDRRWIANTLREEWNRAAEPLGTKVRMYEETKHSSASRWHSSGMPLDRVRRMLRHRDARSTERYAKLADSALVEAFGRHRSRPAAGLPRARCAHGVLMSQNRAR